MLNPTEIAQLIEDVESGEYTIEDAFADIAAGQYGEDVRKAMYAGLLACYNDGKTGATDAVARQNIKRLLARMDTFERLEEGSTTGDAELIDGRIGYDGEVYQNVGGAIRGQATQLSSSIATVTADLAAEKERAEDADEDHDARISLLENGGFELSEEFLANEIENWLNDHPEATTTVQDGSINTEKFVDNLKTKIGSIDREHYFYFPDLSNEAYYSAGFCVFVSCGKTILFDTGAAVNSEAVDELLTSLFNAGKITNIDYIVISHYHWDHIENLELILENYQHNGCVCYAPLNPTGYYTLSDKDTIVSNYNSVKSVCTNYGIQHVEIDSDTAMEYAEGNNIEFYNSTAEDYSEYNDDSCEYNNYSMVSVINYDGNVAMFPGDIQREAQIRLMSTRNLPRVDLYAIHHHGIQNDDYVPYLDRIYPKINVLQTSASRIDITARASYFANYFSNGKSKITSTAYGKVTIRVHENEATIEEGRIIESVGDNYSYFDIYVDNGSGELGDGTEISPCNSIQTALMLCEDRTNFVYRIHLKNTDTSYTGAYIRERKCTISVDTWGSGKAKIGYLYISNSNRVDLSNLTFIGYVDRDGTYCQTVITRQSSVYFSGCEFTAANNVAITGMQIELSTAYVTGCTFNKDAATDYVAFQAYRYGKLVSNANTFNGVKWCYRTYSLELVIRGIDAVTNVNYYVYGGDTHNINYTLVPSAVSNFDNNLLSLCSTSSSSNLINSNNQIIVYKGANKYKLSLTEM